jgi:hypothetical protein
MSRSFEKDEIVWAKISGYPFWPAYVQAILGSNTYEVVFFGDFSRAHLQENKLKRFEEHSERSDKKNKRLQNALRMAQRVVQGKTSILAERGSSELRLLKKNISTPDLVNKSLRNRSLSNEDQNDTETDLANESTRPERSRFARRFSELARAQSMQGPSSQEQVAFLQSEDINQNPHKPKNSLITSQEVAPVQPETIVEEDLMEIELEETIKQLDRSKSRRTPLTLRQTKDRSLAQSIDATPLQIQNANSIKLSKNGHSNPKTTSTLRNKSPSIEPVLSGIDLLEKNLESIWLALKQNNIDPNSSTRKLREWHSEFQQGHFTNIDRLFDCNIGSYLHLIHSICTDKLRESFKYQTLLEETRKVIESVKNILIDSFFRLREDQKELINKRSDTIIQNIDREISELLRSIDSQNGNDRMGFLQEPGKSSEGHKNGPEESESIQIESVDASHIMPVHNDHLSIDGKTTFRVCKKIAKILYLKRKRFRINKKLCEALSNKIDESLRKMSKSDTDYKRLVCKFIEKLGLNCDYFLNLSFKTYKEGEGELLCDSLQTFLGGDL